MFYRWGEIAYRFRKFVPVAIIAGILALFALEGTQLGIRMSQEGWDDPRSSSTRAAHIELETFGRDNSGDVILLFHAPDGKTLDDPAVFQQANTYLTQLKAENPEQIAHVTSYFEKKNPKMVSPDHRTAFAAVGLQGDGEQTLKSFRAVEDKLTPSTDLGGAKVEIAGATAVADSLDEGMAGDIKRAEVVALPVVAVLLIIVFGSVVAAGMPLIVGVLSILGSLGVLAMLASHTQVNVFAQSVVTLLGLGLAIDYGLFMVSRFREELAAGRDTKTAVANTTATAGQTVVFSAGMVIVALSGLFVFPQAFLKSIAYGAISAVGLAALLSITLLPALFGLLGANVDKWSIRKTAKDESQWESTIWARIPAWAIKHSKLVTVGIVAVLLGLTLPLAGVKFGGINETYLPPNNATRQAQATFDETFPSFRTEPIKLVVTGADNAQLAQIYQQANAVEGLTGRFAPTKPTKDGTTVLSAGIQDRSRNEDVVKQLRALELPDGVNVYIGGTPALEIESIEALFEKLPWMAIYIVVATFILMALVFGSLILPAKAIIMTILGLGATLGILTAMFVDGIGANIFNFTAGPLMSPVLVLIVAIVYGLSTDYEVFLVSRMVEARRKGATTDTAIKFGTAHTGSIITAAALIMIVVCGAFGFSEIVMMKYIAFGMIAALILDATIIRMLLVPAVMHLLREDNWWAPRFVQVAADRMGHGKQPATVAAPAAVAVPTAPAAEPTAATEPAAPEEHPIDIPLEDLDVDTTPVRGGRSVDADSELIPFSELMKRLQQD
ncbi:MMPL family transporter [Corynebacterium epidermidicanis]|uniref:Putative RND superfamily drug exporter n=1 Tax=Corynebacterium epidermidicanis TaxID=1050174 RepID=A0A0G3GZB9_9CORY|nr:MMPL family transporter [Corynebacterium epidermidicanis]AKK04147.1 putative RND superfamily drug exporter [Corynebacterium epidermidicanis]